MAKKIAKKEVKVEKKVIKKSDVKKIQNPVSTNALGQELIHLD